MEATELLEIIFRGEDGKHQFKVNINNPDSLSREIVAFSNSGGGQIFVGVDDGGKIVGLSADEVIRINNLLSNVSSQNVKPSVNPRTENIALAEGLVVVITILEGISKPYMDNQGIIWVKNGADKRKATSREEIQRLFQQSMLIHGDEIPVNNASVADIDIGYFRNFVESAKGIKLDDYEVPLEQLLQNMNLMKHDSLNVSGVLLFATAPQHKLPVFMVKAICYPGSDIHLTEYVDSSDIIGNLEDVYNTTKLFIIRNLRRVQQSPSANAASKLEISEIAIEELLVNALVHRDYFVSGRIPQLLYNN